MSIKPKYCPDSYREIDGDTLLVEVDLDFCVKKEEKVRLAHTRIWRHFGLWLFVLRSLSSGAYCGKTIVGYKPHSPSLNHLNHCAD